MAKSNRDDNLDRHRITDGAKLASMSASFNEGKHMELEVFPAERAMLYKLQKLNDEVKELHRYLEADAENFPGFGTTNTTAMRGNTTTISNSQASAITANTAKTTFPGFGTTSGRALAGNTTTISSTQASAITANTAKFSSVGAYDDRGTEKVFIPFTDFKRDAYEVTYGVRGALATNIRGVLTAVWPGIQGKRVTHVTVHTSANIARSVTPYRLAPGSFTALVSTAGNSNTNLQPTRWDCTVGESYGIAILPGATNVFIQGATLTLG